MQASAGFDPEREDLRDHLRADSDGSRAHVLVQQLVGRSKGLQTEARLESDAAAAERASKLSEAFMTAASVIEKLAPRLRSP